MIELKLFCFVLFPVVLLKNEEWNSAIGRNMVEPREYYAFWSKSNRERQILYVIDAAKSLQSCPTLCDPIDGSPPGSPGPWDSPGKNTGVGCHFLLQCVKVKSESEVSQSCLTLCDPIDGSPPGSPGPWDSPGRNTGEGCHFLLQCMKVKSEREVTQSCSTLSDPIDRSPPDSSVHGIFQARVLEWVAIAFSV